MLPPIWLHEIRLCVFRKQEGCYSRMGLDIELFQEMIDIISLLHKQAL